MKLKGSENMVLINSWYFCFKTMMAHRDPKWKHFSAGPNNHKPIKVIFDGSIVDYPSQSGPHGVGPFFRPPEDYFNEVIQREYMSYVFEQEVLKESHD